MGKPDFETPPEPENPWPIDPRPAMKDLKQILEDSPTSQAQSPQLRRRTAFLVFAGMVLLVWSSWSSRIRHPRITPPYVSREKLSKIEKGMSQKQIRELLGEPPGKHPDCWTYNFSDEQMVRIHFGSMFKVVEIERVQKRLRDSER